LAKGLAERAEVLKWARRHAEAVDAARQAVAARRELAADPATPNDRAQLAVASYNLGFQLFLAGQKTEAERWFSEALAACDQVAPGRPVTAEAPVFRACRGAALHFLGVLRRRAGDAAGAVKLLREAAAIRARLADEFPQNVDYPRDTGLTLDWLGAGLRDLG